MTWTLESYQHRRTWSFWSKPNGCLHRPCRLWNISYKETPRELGLFNSWEEVAQGDVINVYEYFMGGIKKPVFFSVVSSVRSRWNGHKLNHRRFFSHHQETLIYCVGNWALAQRMCGYSKDTEIASGHSGGLSAMCHLVWARELYNIQLKLLCNSV